MNLSMHLSPEQDESAARGFSTSSTRPLAPQIVRIENELHAFSVQTLPQDQRAGMVSRRIGKRQMRPGRRGPVRPRHTTGRIA